MKTRFLFLTLALATMVGFSSCSDDDDNKDVDRNDVPEAYQEALKAKYPEAVNVKWEKTPRYYIAEFQKPQEEYDVWFGSEAEWAMTEIDYGHNLFFIPAAINEALAKSPYGTDHTIEDVSMFERIDRTFYLIEVEPMSGGADTYLYYAPDGTLIKTTTQDITITPDTQL